MSEEDKKAAAIVVKLRQHIAVLVMVITKLISEIFRWLGLFVAIIFVIVLLGVWYQVFNSTALDASLHLTPLITK